MSDKVFLFIDGIIGNSKESNHIGWIPINSIHFQASRTIEYKVHTKNIEPHSSSPAISQITLTKSTGMESPEMFKSFCQLKEHRFIIDVIHTKEEGAGDNFIAAAVESAVGVGSGITRYEIDAGHIASYEMLGQRGEIYEKTIIKATTLTISYNPPLKSNEEKSSFGYDFKMLKAL
ncbi:MAG: type VI secretion system tube protein Hcp [Bdellovibrionota bacterium]